MKPDISKLPKKIFSGEWETGHVQGIAIDTKREFVYFSFTTVLVKMDLEGNLIGTVTGLTGHLGDLDFNDEDGRVYGSLEYKKTESFYVAIFDVDKITRIGMDAENDEIMTTVYLDEVVKDFVADMDDNGKFDGDIAETLDHRYGCSGIDGISFGPEFGSPKDSKQKLMVAYGIYSNVNRNDNDYQIILQFDWRELCYYEKPLRQKNPHKSGPCGCEQKYFIFTGNTTYGIQNLEYDYNTGYWLMAVYNGMKSRYPNYPMYIVDGSSIPKMEEIKGQPSYEEGLVLPLLEKGILDEKSGIYGCLFPYGQTGLISFDNGYYYVSHNDRLTSGKQICNIYLYKWTGESPMLFEKIE